MTLEELQVIIEAQTAQFRKEIKAVQNETKNMTANVNKQVSSIKNIFSRLGKFLAVLGIGKIMKDSIKSAMNAIESENLVSTVFGNMTSDIQQWSNVLQESLGLNGYSVRQNAAVLFNMTKSMGLAKDSALGLSKDLTLLSEDMASFYNLSGEEAFNKIRAGLTGETEPLKALGILVDENTLKQYGYSSSLSNSEKVMIRYNAIMSQTAAAHGDLARTIDSPANQIRILKNNLQLLGIEIGRAFMPIVQVVIPILNSLVRAITRVVSVIATFTSTLFGKSSNKNSGISGLANNMSNAASSAGDFGDAISGAGDTAKKTAKEVNRLMGGFDEINTLNKDNKDSGAGGVGGAAGVGGGLGDLGPLDLGLDEEPDTSGVSKAALKVKAILTDLANFIKKYKEIILSVIGGLIAGLISYFAGADIIKAIGKLILNIKAIPTGIGVAFLNIVSFITAPVVIISALIGAIVAALIYLWQTSEGFRSACIEAWEGIKEIVVTVWESCLKPIFENIKNALLLIWENGLKPLVGAFVDFVEQVAMLLLNLWNSVLQPIFNWLAEILGPVLAGIINVVVNVISAAIQVIMIIIKGILDFLTWGIGLINKLFTLDWKAIWETCKQIVSDIWNNIKSFLSNTWNSISSIAINIWNGIKNTCVNVFNGIKNYISGIMNNIKNIFNGIVDFVAGVFTGNWSRAWNGVKNIFKGVFDSLVWIAKAPLNAIISLINGAISGINSMIRMVNKVPGIEIGQIPKIPYLAKGGIIDNPTLAMVGEAGREAVIPLQNNRGGIQEIATLIASMMPQGNTNNGFGDGDIILMIDGSVIGKVALKQLRKMQRQGNVTLIPT